MGKGGGKKSKTVKPTTKAINWKGKDDEFELDLIDTPGLLDSESKDFKHINAMIDELKDKKVEAFVLVVRESDIKRFSSSFKAMLLIFMSCYGKEFLEKNAIVEVTYWSHSTTATNRRAMNE